MDEYQSTIQWIKDNREVFLFIFSLVSFLTSVGTWRTAYNTFRVARWSCRGVKSVYVTRRTTREKAAQDQLAALVHAALTRELDNRTAPTTPKPGERFPDSLDHTPIRPCGGR